MKEGWEYKKLIDVCDVYQPKTISTSKLVNNGPYYVYGANGIIGKYINFNHEESEVLLTCRGASCGNINVSKPKSWINGNAMVIHPLNEKITKEYLSYYLKVIDYSKVITGAAQPQITRSSLSDTFILYHSIDQQRRIVSYLDSSFKLIDEIKNKALKSLTEAKALFQSAIAEAMEPKEGWKEKTLGEIAEIKGGKRVPKGYKLLTEPTNHKYIRVADFNDFGSITLENIQYISDEVYNQIKRYTISSKDVYISIAGTIGKSGIIPKELEGANLTENACKLVLDSCAYKYFVYYFTKSTLFLNQIKKLTMISAQPKLALTRLATVNIPLPPLPTQKLIVSHLDSLSSKVRAIEEKYQKMVEECDALKQAMLRDVFE